MTSNCKFMHGKVFWSVFFFVFLAQIAICNRCGQSEIYCRHENVCVSKSFACDGIKHCILLEDESIDDAGCCPLRNLVAATRVNRPCRPSCTEKRKCKSGRTCLCDHECGMSCIMEENECYNPPEISHQRRVVVKRKNSAGDLVAVNQPYRFQDFAFYECQPGYKLAPDIPRRCHARRNWTENIQCVDMGCSSPLMNIINSGGYIVGKLKFRYELNETVQLACPSTHRLLGSETRTCMSHGRWSGLLTVCDEITSREECPHPGIPMNGYISSLNFSVGAEITFSCNTGFILIGESTQYCTWLLQWSDGGAPICHDERFNYLPNEFTIDLQESSQRTEGKNPGKSINVNANMNEIYFFLHLSIHESNTDNKLVFIEKILSKLAGSVFRYSLIIFGETYNTIVNASVSSDQELAFLTVKRMISERQSRITPGSNLHNVLMDTLSSQIFPSFNKHNGDQVERHLFVIVDDAFSLQYKVIELRNSMLKMFSPVQFYSIVFGSADTVNKENIKKLIKFSLKEENFVYVREASTLNEAVAKIVPIEKDFSQCGESTAEETSIRNLAFERTVNGIKSSMAAWPWHAVVTKYRRNIVEMYNFPFLKGGGSIINSMWILTAAHLFDGHKNNFAHLYAVTVGTSQRPKSGQTLSANAKVFKAKHVIIHGEFNYKQNLDYDFALVKLGRELNNDGIHFIEDNETPEDGELKFTRYIRPVCLPCDAKSGIEKLLKQKNKKGEVVLKGTETDKEKCLKELRYLHNNWSGGVVAIGFGHNQTRRASEFSPITMSRYLHHVLLRVVKRDGCKEAIGKIHRELIHEFDKKYYTFTNRMMCARGEATVLQDSCNGDSGGCLMRQIYNENTKKSTWVQIAIVSFGYGCGQTYINNNAELVMYPGYYANVMQQLSWIRDKVDNFVEANEDRCANPEIQCSNNSRCLSTIDSYKCICNDGFKGDGFTCTDINECEVFELICADKKFNSECVNMLGSYACKCKNGYKEKNGTCLDIDECNSALQSCSESATCHNTEGSFKCTCDVGYELESDVRTCTDVDECGTQEHDCSVDASCQNTIGSFICACNRGYMGDGKVCTDINECNTINCRSNSYCRNTLGSYECICHDGYLLADDVCEDINECMSSHDCSSNTICKNSPGSYICKCMEGYQKLGELCEDIDECEVNNVCSSDATCHNTIGSYNCYCKTGFTGNGELCSDIDECHTIKSCSSDATCQNTIGSYTCLCKTGFSGNGRLCEDIDECRINSACSSDATCRNTVGSYTCLCKTGFTGNGKSCDDVNECSRTDSCSKYATCRNTVGSYNCYCKTGFTGSGKSCSDVNECSRTSACSKYATCRNTVGSYNCYCKTGFTGNGKSCNDVNECSGNNGCSGHATCRNTVGSYSCFCKSGFTGNGRQCTDIDECKISPSKCEKGAECENTIGSYKCNKKKGFLWSFSGSWSGRFGG